MKIIVQRVKHARVINDSIDNEIERGFCLLVGVAKILLKKISKSLPKIANARLFEDENDKLNLNIQQVNGQILSVSQFTLYADVKKVIVLDFQIQKALKKRNNFMKDLMRN